MTFIVAGIVYFAFVNLSILDPFEKAFKDFKFTDMYYSERINETQRNNKIIIVNIKHADRFQLAEVINKINENEPKVIGLDVIFEDKKTEFTDSLLKASIASKDNIVTAYFHDNDSIVNNHEYFQFKEGNKGYINLDLKGQNSVIRDFLGVKGNEKRELAFATQLALKAGYLDEAYALKELQIT